jgi:hypothetical protein
VDVSNQSVATTVIVLSNTSVERHQAGFRYQSRAIRGTTRVDGMDANFYSDFNTDSWYTCFLRRNSVDNFVTVVDVLKSLPVTGDVLTFDDDTIATVLSSAAEFDYLA